VWTSSSSDEPAKPIQRTACGNAWRGPIGENVDASHSSTCPVASPLANTCPSGANATEVTGPCARTEPSGAASPGIDTKTLPALSPTAQRDESGENATVDAVPLTVSSPASPPSPARKTRAKYSDALAIQRPFGVISTARTGPAG